MGMIQPIVKQAGPEDLQSLLPFIKAYYEFDSIPFQPVEIGRSLTELLRNPSLGRVWIVYAGKESVGYVIVTFGYDLEFGGFIATVTELFIVPAHRGRGMGTQVLQFVENTCRDLGIRALELQVEQDNVEAQAFYRKLGFNTHERIPLSKRLARPVK